jgi:CRISPR/Cas system-associated exonuclease Cas4 (RecB family)
MNISIKDMANYLRCPYALLNRLTRQRFEFNDAIWIGTLVHAARTKLNPIKRRYINGNNSCAMGKYITDAVHYARIKIPPKTKKEPIIEKAHDILLQEWLWETSLLKNSHMDTIYPIKLEESVKIPPGIYGMIDGILMEDHLPYPIEYKTWESSNPEMDMFQLTAYCVGLSYRYRRTVQKGILQYSSPPHRAEMTVHKEDEERISDLYKEIMLFLETEQAFRKTLDKACRSCGYLDCQHRRQ